MSEVDIPTIRRRLDRQFEALRSMPAPIPLADRYRHGIETVGRGGYFRIRGLVYRVESISEYREKRERWYELERAGR